MTDTAHDCACGAFLILGSLATDLTLATWRARHAACLAPVPERVDVPALCASVGYSAEPYGDAGALVTGTEADAVACARALRREGWRVVRTGRILSVTP